MLAYANLKQLLRAILLAHAGQQEAACAKLESAYPVPRLIWWVILGNPAFDSMRSTPCFRALSTRVQAHVNREREAIDALRRAGKIPDRTGAMQEQNATPS